MVTQPNQPEYIVERDDSGLLDGVRRHSDGVLLRQPNRPDYFAFLNWNSEQAQPQETSECIFPNDHLWFGEAQKLIEHCKAEGIVLFIGSHRRCNAARAMSLFGQSSQSQNKTYAYCCSLCQKGQYGDIANFHAQ